MFNEFSPPNIPLFAVNGTVSHEENISPMNSTIPHAVYVFAVNSMPLYRCMWSQTHDIQSVHGCVFISHVLLPEGQLMFFHVST